MNRFVCAEILLIDDWVSFSIPVMVMDYPKGLVGYRFRYPLWGWAIPKGWLGIVFDTRGCRTINHWLSVRLESLAPLSILPILIKFPMPPLCRGYDF